MLLAAKDTNEKEEEDCAFGWLTGGATVSYKYPTRLEFVFVAGWYG